MTASPSIVIKRLRSLVTKTRSRGLSWLSGRLRVEAAASTAKLRHSWRTLSNGVKGRISGAAVARTPGASQDVLYCFIDLEVCPITFDVVSYLASAELHRRRNRYSTLHVVLVPGTVGGLREEIPEYEAAVDADRRRWRLNHVVIPLFRLFPHCSGYTVCSSRAEAQRILRALSDEYFPKGYSVNFPIVPPPTDLCEAARAGEKVLPMLRATPMAQEYVRQFVEPRANGRRVVVLNLRKYGYMPGRDSNDDAWIRFANWLDSTKWLPIFVQDTDAALDPLPAALEEFTVFEAVPWNLDLRMALYERADLTMAIAQGPMQLCWLNDRCRYAMFVKPGSSPQTSEKAITGYGFEMGKSPPYAVAGQRWVWTADGLPELIKTFEEMTA